MIFACTLFAAYATTPPADEPWLGNVGVRLSAELGALAPLHHKIQFSKDGTLFDYVKDGGQDVLFPFARLQAELDIKRHTITFLYQPLDLRSEVQLQKSLLVDGAEFPADSPVDLRYGFSFFRLSWMYDVLKDPDREIGLGLSLQIRNANIVFSSGDGKIRRVNRDVGPVPVLKFRARHPIAGPVWFGFEIDGFYAPIKYLNGGTTDVVGAIVDTSLRSGVKIRGGDVFVNLRYIGGGAEGTDQSPEGPGDGFVKNWLHFGALSLGASIR